MKRWQLAWRLVGVGFFIGGSIVLGIGLGYWLDGKLNTRPIFMIIGLLMGVATAGYGVYQMVLPLVKKRNGDNQ
ncbi:MAG: AtpZ/AtpI family protein [Dehalococcoidales bacterium]|nr:AtpZ/AtpI family protein [Dehalococcoidales bacterium]